MLSFGKKLFFFVFLSCVILLNASFVLALEIHYPDILGNSINDTSQLPEYARYFFNAGLILAGFITVIIVAFGGVYYLISYSKGKFTSEAKEWIKSGITGLLIVVCTYLIVFTINPDLIRFKFLGLPQVDFSSSSNPSIPSGVEVTTFKEIPIGILTENLLTRPMDCYGFDQSGNPVDGDSITTDVLEPTYMKHDKADCLLQLLDGAQKKAQVIATLANEINKLTNTCSCEGKCDGAAGGPAGCDAPTTCPNPDSYTCGGGSAGGSCLQSPGTADCCPDGVKDKIEHGPVSVSVNAGGSGAGGSCATTPKDYKGLDEFRCPNPSDNSTPCSDIPGYVETTTDIEGKIVTIIDKTKWEKLNLIQQLTYFKEKIASWTEDSGIQKDIDVLDQARAALADCYLAIPYIDLVKTYEYTDKTKNIILTAPETFFDPVTNVPINISKYCQGFNYANSSCLQKCNNACPDTSFEAMQLYGACTDPNTQESCIEDAYKNRPCIYGTNASQTFGDCITSCQTDCTDNCGKKYLICSDEYNFCKSQCDSSSPEGNSQCVLDNAGSCLFGASNFQYCATNAVDSSGNIDKGNMAYCINNAYTCKNGSDQYAGYPDCAQPSNCPSKTDKTSCETSGECSWNGLICQQNYSASYFYNNPIDQKCIKPYIPADPVSACYSSTNTTDSCINLCPETSKCPATSLCPDCPCDKINQTINFSIPKNSVSDKTDPGYNAGNEGYTNQTQPIYAYQMVGSQCNSYSYNDDPLTFYCQDSWWTDPNREALSPIPKGDYMVCDKSGEIPLGQTVDDAKTWAKQLISQTDSENIINKDIQNLLDQAIKIGKAKDDSIIGNYCKCDAKLVDNKPICTSGCAYDEQNVPVLDADGNPTGDTIPQCSCNFVPCKGNSCEQITDYLSQLWNYYKQLKTDFIDFYAKAITIPESDILKELIYSRKTTDTCSQQNTAFGAAVRMLNCTRVEDELISPVINGEITFNNKNFPGDCYGTQLGMAATPSVSLTDNWFCCANWSATPPPNNNPIYDIQN